MFDIDQDELADCVFVHSDGSTIVASRYLKRLHYKSDGLAAIWVAGEWMYVNRRGTAIITGVPNFDNGPDEFHDGLVRFVKNKKYGFANRRGKIVVSPIYDGAQAFHEGRAQVCLGCVDKCVDPDCEHHMFSGGQWLSISTKGEILK